jgi:membrane dipeptidase
MDSDFDLEQFHKEIVIWDAHRDVIHELPYKERYLSTKVKGVDLHLPLLKKGSIDIQTFAFCYATSPGKATTIQAISDIEKILNLIENSLDIVLAFTVSEALEAKKEGKIAAFFSFEGGEPISDDIWLLRFFYRIGFRAMGLTWNYRNLLADGGYEGRNGYGISMFGRKVVKEMNHLGMVVDLAHLSPQSMRDVIEIADNPVIHSHGCTRAIHPEHPRTLDDEMLEAIAGTGGLFCVTTVPAGLVAEPKKATIDDLFRHIDHAVRVMGEDHVGLGADFDVQQSHVEHPIGEWTVGLEEADRWMNVTKGLVEMGYSQERIKKIMGENLSRVYKTVFGS